VSGALLAARGIAFRYDDREVLRANPHFAALRDALALARPRPATPFYARLSGILQVQISRALVGAVSPGPRFADLGSLLSLFASCSLCGDCLDACPLYNGELSGMLGVHGARPPLAEMVDVGRWLAACAGCGMCESSCDQDVPLMLLIASLSQQIQGATHQRAGEPARPLPWASG